MPTFTPAERESIRATLLETGRRLFTTYGLKKTSLEELTQPAGIAKSSFYSFFDSKEELYLELLALEGPRIEQQIMQPFVSASAPRQAIADFLRTFIAELEHNPLTKRMLTNPEELQMVAQRVEPLHLERKMRQGVLPIIGVVQRWQAEGKLIAADPTVIGGVIRAVTMLTLHQEDIGPTIYPAVIDLIIDLVARGLSRPSAPADTTERGDQ